MTPRTVVVLLISASMVSCTRDRNGGSRVATRDTTSGAGNSAHPSPDVGFSANAGQCELPQPLQCADRLYLTFFERTAASLVSGYRLPSNGDFENYWTDYGSFVYKPRDDADSTKAPYWTKGDFNNDGIVDYAYILIRTADGSKSLFAFLSNGNQYSSISLQEGFQEEMGLATQQGGTFTTAAGNGYSEPSGQQPATIRAEKHAIAFFMFESAASLFIWDPSRKGFVRVWMS